MAPSAAVAASQNESSAEVVSACAALARPKSEAEFDAEVQPNFTNLHEARGHEPG